MTWARDPRCPLVQRYSLGGHITAIRQGDGSWRFDAWPEGELAAPCSTRMLGHYARAEDARAAVEKEVK